MVSQGEEMSSSESPSRQMTVVDVYDLAAVIGKDFERLIDQFGAESVTHIMPKVISALELLEAFATRNERENEEIVGLKSVVNRLEAEKVEKKEGRQKFEKELEQIEENYKTEIRQLWEMAQKLQEENKRLSNNLEQKVESPTQAAVKEDELKMMLTMRETLDRQRDLLKSVQKETDEKAQEIDCLHQQIDKLQRNNKELTRKNKAVQNQGRCLVEEKTDLISLLQDREQVIMELQLKLDETEKVKKDLEETKAEELHGDRDNVPRFTLAELREVLQEKNELKARVMELEEELAQLRPALTPSPQPNEKNEDEELLVYGPINREPEEKLFPWKYQRKDSGVRKFLQRAFHKRDQQQRLNDSGASSESFRGDVYHAGSPSSANNSASSVSFSKTPVVATARCRPVASTYRTTRPPRRRTDDNSELNAFSKNIIKNDCSMKSDISDQQLFDPKMEEPIEFSLDEESFVSLDNSLDAGRRNSALHSSSSSLRSLSFFAKFKK